MVLELIPMLSQNVRGVQYKMVRSYYYHSINKQVVFFGFPPRRHLAGAINDISYIDCVAISRWKHLSEVQIVTYSVSIFVELLVRLQDCGEYEEELSGIAASTTCLGLSVKNLDIFEPWAITPFLENCSYRRMISGVRSPALRLLFTITIGVGYMTDLLSDYESCRGPNMVRVILFLDGPF